MTDGSKTFGSFPIWVLEDSKAVTYESLLLLLTRSPETWKTRGIFVGQLTRLITPTKYVVIFSICHALYLDTHCSVLWQPNKRRPISPYDTSKVVAAWQDVPSWRMIAKLTVNQPSQADVLYDKYGACYLVTLLIQNTWLTHAILTQEINFMFYFDNFLG